MTVQVTRGRGVPCVAIFVSIAACTTNKTAPFSAQPAERASTEGPIGGSYALDDVWLSGRFDRAEPGAARFAWSGSSASLRFRGTELGVDLEDGGQNRYWVIVDGAVPSQKLVPVAGRHSYVVARGLAETEHTVTLYKLTEAFVGEGILRGFAVGEGGTRLPWTARPSRRIEIIGDSISAGYGDECTSKDAPFSVDTENHHLTYGAIAARDLGAELHAIAWSGKGVFTNRADPTDTIPMPPLWRRTLPERSESSWNFAKWQPDLVLINLGTNDEAPEVLDRSPLEGAYAQLLADVRSAYPEAEVLCAVGPALSDDWPGDRRALTELRTAIRNAIAARERAGDTRISTVSHATETDADGWGCDWHPSAAKHGKMALDVEAAVRARLGW